VNSEQLRAQMINRGLARVRHFSWKRHTDKILDLVSKRFLKL